MKVLRSEKVGRYVLELIEEEHPWDVKQSKGTRGRKIFAPDRKENRVVYRVTIANTAKSSSWWGRMGEVGDNEKRFGTKERATQYFDANYKSLSRGNAPLEENTVKLTKKQLKQIIREEKRRLQEHSPLEQYQAGWNAGEDTDVYGQRDNIAFQQLAIAIEAAMDKSGEQAVLDYLRSFCENY